MTPELLRAVRESVESGKDASSGNVFRDAMRLWQRRRIDDAERLDAIRARIRRLLDDPRPALSSEEVDESLEALFAQARADADRVGCASSFNSRPAPI